MTNISIKNFVEESKKYMIDNSNKVNTDKTIPFQDIYTFLEKELNEEEITVVMKKIALLKEQITEKANKELSQYGYDFISKNVMQSYFHLGIIYLLMIRTNKEKSLNINDELLYFVTNAMRNVPYSKYDESIMKLLYPDLIEIVIQNKSNTNVSMILNILTDRIIDDKVNFNEERLKEDMDTFIFYEVYSRLGIPEHFVGEERIRMELALNKYSILKTIQKAGELKNPYASKFQDKLVGLDTYDSLDMTCASIYLEFIKWLSETEENKFRQVNLQLSALCVSHLIDITTLDKEKLTEIIFKVEKIPYKSFSAILDKEKHIV